MKNEKRNISIILLDLHMGLFKKKDEQPQTKCKECGLEFNDPVRLDRHMKKAHRHAPQRKFDEQGFTTGGMW
ncbi:MAG: hypothetical protein KGH88_04020 [Thaumarchaeota archaeon]|nr:hypothetical protein [Nitrososphaerota archaeon]